MRTSYWFLLLLVALLLALVFTVFTQPGWRVAGCAAVAVVAYFAYTYAQRRNKAKQPATLPQEGKDGDPLKYEHLPEDIAVRNDTVKAILARSDETDPTYVDHPARRKEAYIWQARSNDDPLMNKYTYWPEDFKQVTFVFNKQNRLLEGVGEVIPIEDDEELPEHRDRLRGKLLHIAMQNGHHWNTRIEV